MLQSSQTKGRHSTRDKEGEANMKASLQILLNSLLILALLGGALPARQGLFVPGEAEGSVDQSATTWRGARPA
jgi:hypothetical protein